MKYKLKKQLFWIPLLIFTPLLFYLILTNGINSLVGAEINCPQDHPEIKCKISIGKEQYILERGETKIINQKNIIINTLNYGVWILIIIIFIINHILYNRKYKIKHLKKDINKIINRLSR